MYAWPSGSVIVCTAPFGKPNVSLLPNVSVTDCWLPRDQQGGGALGRSVHEGQPLVEG